jgi:hypothetical protein
MLAPAALGEQARAARDEAAVQECYKAGVLLPNADRAFIVPRKLVEYSTVAVIGAVGWLSPPAHACC